MKTIIFFIIILCSLILYGYIDKIENIFIIILTTPIDLLLIYSIYKNFKNEDSFKSHSYFDIKAIGVRVQNFYTFLAGLFFSLWIVMFFDSQHLVFYSYLILLDLFYLTTIKFIQIK